MNLKALKEKKNELLNKADELIQNAETEVRSLTEDEQSEFRSLTKEIEDINSQIAEQEDLMKQGEKIEITEEKRNMEEKVIEKELRGLEQFLKKQDGEEVRALQKTDAGNAVIPENVEGTIVLKMEETSAAFAKARKFPSVNGTLKIAKETATSAAGFVGEGENVSEIAMNLGEVKLTQKRVGAAISLSNQLIHDSAVDIVDYSVNLLARRAAKAVEKSMFNGTGTEDFNGMLKDSEVSKVDVSGAVTIDSLMDLYNSIHPEFLSGAEFYMARKFFNQVAKLKDGNGHFYLQNGVVNGKLTYTLFGSPVVVTDALEFEANAGTPVVFGSIEDAYGVMIKKGFALQHVIGDTTQALRGSQLLVLDGYMDGAVYNPQALAKMVVTA